MLDLPEQSLVTRDRALPGLATLLDDERFAELLERATGSRPVSLAARYLRYKPGTRCLAAYTCRLQDRTVSLHAVAHGEDAAVRLEKAEARCWTPGLLGEGVWSERAQGIAVYAFPNDLRVPSLASVADPERLQGLLRRVFSESPDLWGGTLRRLAYKPERRYVAAVEVEGVPRAVLRLYSRAGFASLRPLSLALAKGRFDESVTRLGRSQRRAAVGYRWVEGEPLHEIIADPARDLRGAVHAGEALAALHLRRVPRAAPDASVDIAQTRASAETVATLLPHLAPRLAEAVRTIARRLSERIVEARIVHGDFYAKQVVVTRAGATLVDLDALGWGEPLRDLGTFAAHLVRDAVGERISFARAEAAHQALLGGYEDAGGSLDRDVLELYTAAALLWIAPHFFRGRDVDWPARTESLLAILEGLLRNGTGAPVRSSETVAPQLDPKLPFLESALDPARAQGPLARALGDPELTVERVELIRHKPGRRGLLEYQVSGAGEPTQRILGKLRARGLDRTTYERMLALHAAGFGPDSADGISVPEALGVVPAFRMWLQRRVVGIPGEVALASEQGPLLAQRAAAFVRKLQCSQVRCARVHTMDDELRILHARLDALARQRTGWAPRLGRLLRACDAIGGSLPRVRPMPAHRDLHPDQLLLDADRLCVLDFDLLCAADPALDVGNFRAHTIELALRLHGDPGAFAVSEHALAERFLEGPDAARASALEVSTTLSLVRHISISTQFTDRLHTTEALLDLCEQRLDLGLPRNLPKKMEPSR